MRYSIPCKVDGQRAWDAELDLADLVNYVTEKVLGNMGFVRVNLCDYGRKMVNDVNVEIHGVKFKADFVVLDYIRMNLTKFKEGIEVIDLTEEVGSSSEEVVKMGKANRNKGYNINKLTPPPSLKVEEIPPTSLKESKPILEDLDNYVVYKKKLDEILIVDTGASVSVLPYSLYKDLGLRYPRPYQTNLTMADNTEAKAMGEVKNTCGAILTMGRVWLCIDDGVISIPIFTKHGHKLDVVAFEMEDIEDDMERALAMEEYFNPFKNLILFKKLVDFLGSLLVQLKNLDLGNEGYETYKKIDGDRDWHARFEIVTPSGRKFNRAFKTKTTTRKLSGKFKTEDVLREDDRAPCRVADMLCRAAREKSRKDTLPNPLIAEYERRNKRNTITYLLQPMSNANLKWKDLSSVERHAYYEKLEMMKLEYIYEGDGDVFVDYSWERTLLIDNKIYPEWVLEFFSTLYFDKVVDRTNLMKDKYWIIADHLYKHAPGTKENSVICAGHYVTKIASFLGYYMDDEIKKCSEPIDFKERNWNTKPRSWCRKEARNVLADGKSYVRFDHESFEDDVKRTKFSRKLSG
ncbi:retrovirus-related pol polyprotein from transposon TNT 1-94 [Tanacetum coccineum]|uniref:Retrovirus-related pol polyprotein from transposon TNT 1-94 n=1 Tax=Tanacetum coccineum TaxID=301880 RepID=A0ABQ5IP15_9ASTR